MGQYFQICCSNGYTLAKYSYIWCGPICAIVSLSPGLNWGGVGEKEEVKLQIAIPKFMCFYFCLYSINYFKIYPNFLLYHIVLYVILRNNLIKY